MNKTTFLAGGCATLLLTSGCGGGSSSSNDGAEAYNDLAMLATAYANDDGRDRQYRHHFQVNVARTPFSYPGYSSFAEARTFEEPIAEATLLASTSISVLGCEYWHPSLEEPAFIADHGAWTRGLNDVVAEEVDMDSIDTVSAGEVIVVSSPAGTLLEVPREDSVEPYYQGYLPELQTLPTTLTVDVPGDVIPALSSLTLPEQSPIERFRIVGKPGLAFEAADTIRWTPGKTGSVMAMTVFGDLDNDSESHTLDAEDRLQCTFPDTGEYRLPDAVRNIMRDDFSGDVHMYRIDFAIERHDDTLVQTLRVDLAVPDL